MPILKFNKNFCIFNRVQTHFLLSNNIPRYADFVFFQYLIFFFHFKLIFDIQFKLISKLEIIIFFMRDNLNFNRITINIEPTLLNKFKLSIFISNRLPIFNFLIAIINNHLCFIQFVAAYSILNASFQN